jgi:hypothetical protein
MPDPEGLILQLYPLIVEMLTDFRNRARDKDGLEEGDLIALGRDWMFGRYSPIKDSQKSLNTLLLGVHMARTEYCVGFLDNLINAKNATYLLPSLTIFLTSLYYYKDG